MGARYRAPIEAVAVTAAQDLWELLTASTTTGRIHRVHIDQSSDTDSEMLRVTGKRVTGAPTSGSGGSTITPTPLSPKSTAAGATVERNNTTRLSGGTSTTLFDEGFNVLNGFEHVFTEPAEIAPSTRFVVGLETVPADSLTISGWIEYEECGS